MWKTVSRCLHTATLIYRGSHLQVFCNRDDLTFFVQSPILLKSRLRHICFPINFAKILRMTVPWNISEWLLLEWETTVNQEHLLLNVSQIFIFWRDFQDIYKCMLICSQKSSPLVDFFGIKSFLTKGSFKNILMVKRRNRQMEKWMDTW